jgi:alpha-glucosidase (family GH31 glycosyl hydrolase)
MTAEQTLTTPHTRIRLRWLAGNAVRVTHAPPGAADFPPDRPWLPDVLLPGEPAWDVPGELSLDAPNGLLQARDPFGQELFSEISPPRLDIHRRTPFISFEPTKIELRAGLRRVDQGICLCLSTLPGESFYGWGEQFTAFRRQSGRLRLKIRDAIAPLQGRGETYSAIPFFFSSRGYGFWLLNSHTSRWKIDPQAHTLEIEADGPGADYILIYGPSYRRILQTYTALTGRPPLLPRWAFGLWVTSYPQGHQDGVIAHIQEHRRRGIPLDAVILDYHWEERFHNFRWRRSLVPDPDGLISNLKALGARLGLILTPFVNARNRPLQKFVLKTLAHNLPPGLENDDERALPEYAQARAAGYLAHEHARWWFGSGGMVDFANPQAAAWWNGLMRPLYAQGVAFFKNDDGEYLPEDAHSSLGIDGREYHNLYGFYYGRALYQGMQELPRRRPLIYARSVWAGSQRYPAIFLGDQKPTFAGIRSTLRAGLGLGLLGFAYWTADVFGLDGKTTLETHMRYAQWALLVPIARYFWRPPAIDDTRFPWSYGPQAEANFRNYTELRYRWLPYYVALAWEAYQTGLPILRPLALEFQGPAVDSRLDSVDDQAMLGSGIMLCPVVEPGATTRHILLPPGIWHDYWSTQCWQGPGEIDYSAPLACLPILVRGGTILPQGPVLQYISDDHRFDPLQFHFWPPYPAEGILYDDDGRSQAYLQGAYAITRLAAQRIADRLRLHIAPAEGNFPEMVHARRVELIVHQATPPQQVLFNNQPGDAWHYNEASAELLIRLNLTPQKGATIDILFPPGIA